VVVRREEPHPGASYNLFDPHGLRHQALITDSQAPTWPTWKPATGFTRGWKTGSGRQGVWPCQLPCSGFQAIRVWLLLVQMAQDLLAWARRLCLLFLEAVSAALPAAACGRAAGAQRQAEHPAARRPLGLGG
jgi:hypothetical protein